MLHNDLLGIILFFAYFFVTGLLPIILRIYFKAPFELVRKMLHLVITLSIFPLLYFFSTWFMAVLAAFLLVLIMYPVLKWVEDSSFFKRVAVEREGGEFKKSLVIVQLSIATQLFIFWGLLGEDWKYVAIVSVLAWGLGDAAAALVGKSFGRRKVQHKLVDGMKTVEGSHSMLIVSSLAAFIVLLMHGGSPWYFSLVVAFIVGIVSSVVELFSRRGMDTLTVPFSAGFTALTLLALLSFLGV